MTLTQLTISQATEALNKKQFSAIELTKAYLDKIEKEDKKIHSYLSVEKDSAISQAKAADERIKNKENGNILDGIPCSIKDNILVDGMKCTAGSKILENYTAPYDATVSKKIKERGAVVLGKTNPDEFAMGSSTENSAFGVTKNPHDLERVSGGSSGGSAAAVAADLCAFSLGSDTGGSIRQPASFCGVVGLKPTYGAVSRYGLIAFASSLDQIGPITKTVGDCRIVFDAIRGRDNLDSTSAEPKSKTCNIQAKNLKIGVPKEYFIEGMDPGVEKIVKNAIKKYSEAGASIEEISLPHAEYALPCYYIIASSEASATLARYDGVKYGLSEKGKNNLLDIYLDSRKNGFGAEARRRIMLGTYSLSSGYYDAYYLRAQKVRSLIRDDFEKAFKKIDVILAPVSPTPAFKIGEKTDNPLTMYLSDIFTVSVNLAGLPALSLPCGNISDDSAKTFTEVSPKCSMRALPVGLQIIGKKFQEEEIFQTAEIFEKL